MNSTMKFTLEITPICSACGKELSDSPGLAATDPDRDRKNGPLDHDFPSERLRQRVYINPSKCGCWIFKGDLEANHDSE